MSRMEEKLTFWPMQFDTRKISLVMRKQKPVKMAIKILRARFSLEKDFLLESKKFLKFLLKKNSCLWLNL